MPSQTRHLVRKKGPIMKNIFLIFILYSSFATASDKLHCDADGLDGGLYVTVEKNPDGRVFMDVLGRREMTVSDEAYYYTKAGENENSLDFLFQLNRYSLEMDFGLRTNDGEWIHFNGQCKVIASKPKI